MTAKDKTIEHLIDLANDLYAEGYACGIGEANSDKWFAAWAVAMQRVAAGEEYTQNMVIDIFNESPKS